MLSAMRVEFQVLCSTMLMVLDALVRYFLIQIYAER